MRRLVCVVGGFKEQVRPGCIQGFEAHTSGNPCAGPRYVRETIRRYYNRSVQELAQRSAWLIQPFYVNVTD